MKTTIKMLLLASLLAGLHVVYGLPKPPVIKVEPLTAVEITKEVTREQKEKEYARATTQAGMVYRKNGCRQSFAEETGRIAVDDGISPRVLAALVFIESSCNPTAISGKASVGLCQINPLVWHYTQAELKNPNQNLRIGASILASYVRKFGLKEGLHRYNGLGDDSDDYSNKVLTAAGIQVL
jgi:hypothetical protein